MDSTMSIIYQDIFVWDIEIQMRYKVDHNLTSRKGYEAPSKGYCYYMQDLKVNHWKRKMIKLSYKILCYKQLLIKIKNLSFDYFGSSIAFKLHSKQLSL